MPNRLIRMEANVDPNDLTAGDGWLEHTCDYAGRRVTKGSGHWDPSLNADEGDRQQDPALCRRFVWRNWLPLPKLVMQAPGAASATVGVLRKCTRGPDLAGHNQSPERE